MANEEFTYPRKPQSPTEAHNARALEDYLRDRSRRTINASEISADFIEVGDTIKSSGYEEGVSGWIINQDGSAEFNDVTIRGTIDAQSGIISGDLLLDGGTLKTAASGQRIEINQAADTLTHDGILFYTGDAGETSPGYIQPWSGFTDLALLISSPYDGTESSWMWVTQDAITLWPSNSLALSVADDGIVGSVAFLADAEGATTPGYSFVDDPNTGISIGASGEVTIISDSEIAWGLDYVGDNSMLNAKGDTDDSIRFDQGSQVFWFYIGGTLVGNISGNRMQARGEYLTLPVKTSAGAPATTPVQGDMYLNTVDNNVRIFENSAWRTVASW